MTNQDVKIGRSAADRLAQVRCGVTAVLLGACDVQRRELTEIDSETSKGQETRCREKKTSRKSYAQTTSQRQTEESDSRDDGRDFDSDATGTTDVPEDA